MNMQQRLEYLNRKLEGYNHPRDLPKGKPRLRDYIYEREELKQLLGRDLKVKIGKIRERDAKPTERNPKGAGRPPNTDPVHKERMRQLRNMQWRVVYWKKKVSTSKGKTKVAAQATLDSYLDKIRQSRAAWGIKTPNRDYRKKK